MMQDEFQQLQEENIALREELGTLRALVAELLPLKAQVAELSGHIEQLESRLSKDSHTSHFPPSSDRFGRQHRTKSLREPTERKPGAQPGHPGSTLCQVSTPDQIIVHAVTHCASCQQDLLGPSMRVGTVKAMVSRCAEQLAPVEQEIKEHLQSSQVLHQDETGVYVMGKRLWMHVSATDTLTHYAVHPKRGTPALEAIGILPSFTGVSVHDGWTSDWHYGCEHALCNVHHLREVLFLSEQHPQEWALEMKELLVLMNDAVQQAKAAGRSQLNPLEVADWKAQYGANLENGWQANPPDPPLAVGSLKRGRRKQSPARNLLHRLDQHQVAVLLFLDRFDVPFDNSQAERDLRMVKVQQKISGCFRSLTGAEAFCRIRGYISTLRKQGTHVLTALEHALTGHPISPAF